MLKKIVFFKFIIILSILISFLLFLAGFSGCKAGNNIPGNTSNNAPSIIPITVDQVHEILINNEDYFIIDVRSKEEYNQGHLDGAFLIPVDEIKKRVAEIPRNKPVIVYCKTGVRSLEAANILIKSGFKAVYDMKGGITEWQKKGYPVVKENSNAVGTNIENQGFVTLSVAEVYNIVVYHEDYLIVDVRTINEYRDGHIAGVISMPVDELEARIKELPNDKPIIVYCNGSGCNRSVRAAEILIKYGFKKVYNVGGRGIDEWKEKGYPYVTGD
jgi:rhodanese-related sulfurtransferase